MFPDQVVHSIGPVEDKLTQAQRVFEALRSFDATDVTEIYTQCPDGRGLGLAVGNRLRKAAGFHEVEADSEKIVLGITGGTGAGKSTALAVLRKLGAVVLDCDRVYHEMLSENVEMQKAISNAFPGVFRSDGTLNRKKLGQEVFMKKEQLEKLNSLVYRFLVPEIQRLIQEAGDSVCAIDAINLLESGLDIICDRTVAITSPTELRVRRIMARDNITEQYARMRITAQKPDEYYRGKCSCELNNDADTAEEFQRAAERFFKRLIRSVREEKQNKKI